MARLMIIDDDTMVSRFLEEHLSADGYEVKSYALAEEAFQAAVQAPPDLFLVDVMLPDATGFQMVGRFRQHPKTHDVPIIMMSGTARHQNQKDIGKGMGADDYLVKPIDSEAVSQKIRQLLASRPKREPAASSFHEKPTASVVPEPAYEAPTQSLPEVPVPPTPEVPQNGDGKDFHLPEFEYGDSREPEKLTQPEVFEEPRKQKFTISPKTHWASGLLVLHMVMAIVQGWMSHETPSVILRGASAIAAGWVLLLGILVAACAILGIMISADQAFSLLVWPAFPIIARAAAVLAGFKLDPQFATPALYWIRPLDVFEMAAILMLGISLRRKPGSSLGKAMLVSLVVALGWCLTNRGYFQP